MGDRFRMEDFVGDAAPMHVTARLSGIFRLQDDATQQAALYAPRFLDEALTVPEESFFNSIALAFTPSDAEVNWVANYDETAVDVDNVNRVLSGLDLLQFNLTSQLKDLQFLTNMDNVLTEYVRSTFVLKALLAVLGAPVIAIALYYILLSAGLLVQQRQGEIAVVKSRGGSDGQVMGIFFIQGLLIVGLAMVLGPPLAVPLAQLIGKSTTFMEFSNPRLLPAVLRPSLYWYALLAATLALIAILAPTWQAARQTIVTYRRTAARENRPLFVHRFFLDIVLVLVGALGYWQLEPQRRHHQPRPDRRAGVRPAAAAHTDCAGGRVDLRGAALCALFRARPLQPDGAERRCGAVVRPAPGGAHAGALQRADSDPGLHAGAGSLYGGGGQRLRPQLRRPGALRRRRRPAHPRVRLRHGVLARACAAGIPGRARRDRCRAHRTRSPDRPRGADSGQGHAAGRGAAESRTRGVVAPRFCARTAIRLRWRRCWPRWTATRAVLADSAFIRRNGLKVGDLFDIDVEGQRVDFVLAGDIGFFPSLYPAEGDRLIANLDYLRSARQLDANEVWLKTAPGQEDDVAAALHASVQNALVVLDNGHELAGVRKEDPVRTGLFGALSLGFMAASVLSVLGFLLYAYLSVQSRALQFGVLRATGLSTRQLIGALATEQLTLIGVGVVLGTALGSAAGWMFTRFLQLSVVAREAVPPFLVETPWTAIFRLYVILVVIFVAALLVSVYLLRRMRVASVLRLGEQ